MSRVSFHTRPYDRLEPYDGKLSRTVLRGGTGSNASLLPDIRSEKDILKLVNALILNTKGKGEKSSEDFWVKAERLYYSALIGYIWYEDFYHHLRMEMDEYRRLKRSLRVLKSYTDYEEDLYEEAV